MTPYQVSRRVFFSQRTFHEGEKILLLRDHFKLQFIVAEPEPSDLESISFALFMRELELRQTAF